jgi:hypothetical protein
MAEQLMRAFSMEVRENAEYLEEAMGIHPPHPTRAFDFCDGEQLVGFMTELKAKKPFFFELEAMCSGPLGKCMRSVANSSNIY